MKSKIFILLSLVLIIIFSITGCNPGKSTPATPEPDVNATVNAAVAATDTAQAGMQATIDAAVARTTTVMPADNPPPTPAPVDSMTLSEEELAVLIDQSVNEAVTAYEEANSTVSAGSGDDPLTQEEIDEAYYAYAYAEDEIAAAMELADLYLDLYYDLAAESIALLETVEEDLSTIAESTTAAVALLEEMGQSLAAGQEIRADAVTQLQDLAQNAASQVLEIKDGAEAWNTGFKGDLENRAGKFSGLQPSQVAGDRKGSLALAADYFNEVRSILQGGGRITMDQMTKLAQLGVNASSSLRGLGGPEMQNLSDRIDTMTIQVSRGELPQARGGLGELERSIPRR